MKTILHQCPQCKHHHGLVWFHNAKARKLGVLCPLNGSAQFVPLDDDALKELDLLAMDGIPEHYTKAAADKLRGKEQLQIVLMNAKPGDTFERNVDTGRNTNQIVAELREKIDQLIQAAKEIDGQIEKLDLKRRQIRIKSHELGAELSKFQTQELFKS